MFLLCQYMHFLFVSDVDYSERKGNQKEYIFFGWVGSIVDL